VRCRTHYVSRVHVIDLSPVRHGTRCRRRGRTPKDVTERDKPEGLQLLLSSPMCGRYSDGTKRHRAFRTATSTAAPRAVCGIWSFWTWQNRSPRRGDVPVPFGFGRRAARAPRRGPPEKKPLNHQPKYIRARRRAVSDFFEGRSFWTLERLSKRLLLSL
jgi:hypothetical protein